MKIKVKNASIVKLDARKDAQRGDLFIAEAKAHVPFPIRRVYFINNFKEDSLPRGGHAHKKFSQAFFAVSGSFVMNMDDGVRKQKVLLNDPEKGIVVGPKLWHTMSGCSEDCVILVLASDYYDERDYVRKYDDFIKLV
ncbi:MAG: FdtA/QdtA family cupin domain-containing protein [bacterium]|nr:FdtA/QdtA family cupin domain-containing protein [bacterium]